MSCPKEINIKMEQWIRCGQWHWSSCCHCTSVLSNCCCHTPIIINTLPILALTLLRKKACDAMVKNYLFKQKVSSSLCFPIIIFFIKWFFWMNFSFDLHLGEPFLEMISMCNLAHFISQVAKWRKKGWT